MRRNSEGETHDRALALVVANEAGVADPLRQILERASVECLHARSAAEALELLKAQAVQLLVVDTEAPGVTGLDLVGHGVKLDPPPVVLVVDPARDDDTAERMIRGGVHDLIRRPIETAQARRVIERALKQLELLDELRRLRRDLQSREGFHRIVGRTPAMERLRAEVDRLSTVDVSVWLYGEAGTGRELIARHLHAGSPRSEHPFVAVDCRLVAEEATPIAWSDADTPRAGLLDQARGGTLYLDSVTELDLDAQGALLRAVRESTADVRLLVSSERSPRQSLDQGRILPELSEHLGAVALSLPRLADRLEDVPHLTRHFLAAIAEVNHLPPMQISPEALKVLARYAWPGNVQELRNAVEHAALLASDDTVRPRDLPERIRSQAQGAEGLAGESEELRPFREAKREVVDAFEAAYLSELLERFGGNVTSASQHSGMLRSALQRLLRKHGIKSAHYRKSAAARRREAQGGGAASKPGRDPGSS